LKLNLRGIERIDFKRLAGIKGQPFGVPGLLYANPILPAEKPLYFEFQF